MRLFRRREIMETDDERCPRCAEKVPEGASECAMCGLDLRPLRSSGVELEREPSGS
jgi:hypothetical protein